jgi:hypothetical protein
VAVYTYFVLQRGHMERLWRMKKEEFVTVDERRRRSRKAGEKEAKRPQDREVGLCTMLRGKSGRRRKRCTEVGAQRRCR